MKNFYKYKLKEVNNKPVVCPTCNSTCFHKRKVLLNTRGFTFLDMGFLNKRASALLCQKCGRYIWFHKGIGKLEKQKDKCTKISKPKGGSLIKRRTKKNRLSKSKKKTKGGSSTKRRTKKKR